MKTLIILALLLVPQFASAQDDCPAGHIRNPAVSPLDHAYMVEAFKASFRGILHREPTMQAGSGLDDGEYYIAAADHFGVYGDDQCHAGWSGYWESWLEVGHGDLTKAQTPARFLPTSAPTPPVVTPPAPTPAPAFDPTAILERLRVLEAKVQDLQTLMSVLEVRVNLLEARVIPTTCKASLFGLGVSCRLEP